MLSKHIRGTRYRFSVQIQQSSKELNSNFKKCLQFLQSKDQRLIYRYLSGAGEL
jgi:hypothetical protein